MIEWYSSTSCTAIPMGAPPRHMATKKVGRNPLLTTNLASSIESRRSESAEIKSLSTGTKLTLEGWLAATVLRRRSGQKHLGGEPGRAAEQYHSERHHHE